MHRFTLILTLLLTTSIFATPFANAEITIHETGAASIGQTTLIHINGTPGDQYLLILSLSGGPTPIPPPHQVSSIDVGFDLIALSFNLAPLGFMGTIPGSGTATAILPFPPDPVLSVLTIHFQAIRHNGILFLGKSNPLVLTPNVVYMSKPTLGDLPHPSAGYTSHPVDDPNGLPGQIVFVGGGSDGIITNIPINPNSISVYNPWTQKFTSPGGLVAHRVLHASNLLSDGKILVTGGAEASTGNSANHAELIDPSNGYSSTLLASTMSNARGLHRSANLPDGRVLITGGTTDMDPTGANPAQAIVENAVDTTDIFDPQTNTFLAGPAMAIPRVGHTATIMADGRVLIVGGFTWVDFLGFKIPTIDDSAEIYTPDGGIGSFGPKIIMDSDRFGHSTILMEHGANAGKLMIFGGAADNFSDPFNPQFLPTVALFDPVTSTFAFHGNMSVQRGLCALAERSNGEILVGGGVNGGLLIPIGNNTVDVYDGSSGGISTFFMQHQRALFDIHILENGAALFTGGGEDSTDPQNFVNFDDAELVSLP